MQVAHGLERPETGKSGRQHYEEAGTHLKNSEINRAENERPQNGTGDGQRPAPQQSIKGGQQMHCSHDTQPCVPMPASEKVEAACRCGMPPGYRRWLKKP